MRSGIYDEFRNPLYAQGIRIVPASGRAPDSMRGFLERIGCYDAAIASNGADILDDCGQIISQTFLETGITLEILSFIRSRGCYVHTYWENTFHYNLDSHWARAYQRSSRLLGVYEEDLDAFARQHPTNKILVMDSRDRIAEVFLEAREHFSNRCAITTSKPEFLEFNPTGTSKGIALASIVDTFHLKMEEFCAFGDGRNDISMLKACGVSVAMANASAEVQSMAKAV